MPGDAVAACAAHVIELLGERLSKSETLRWIKLLQSLLDLLNLQLQWLLLFGRLGLRQELVQQDALLEQLLMLQRLRRGRCSLRFRFTLATRGRRLCGLLPAIAVAKLPYSGLLTPFAQIGRAHV